MGRKKSVYYVNPAELKEEIRVFQQSKDEQMSNELGTMLTNIAQRFASRPNFYGYSYKEDFVSDAIFRMIQQIHKINLDHEKCNPFSYLTMTCYHVFIAKITKEKKYTEAKRKLRDEVFDELEFNEGLHSKHKNEEN